MALLPQFVQPQLSLLVDAPPTEGKWLHELKYDGYRMAIQISAGKVVLLTRSGLNWTDKYPTIAAAAKKLKVKDAYIDGELCALDEQGIASFSAMQAASDGGKVPLVFFAFDLLHLNGENLRSKSLVERKAALKRALKGSPKAIMYSDDVREGVSEFYKRACEHGAEGIMCKQMDAPYVSGDRGLWLKVKCHQRAEFVVVGYSDPEGSRKHFGSLLLGYYDDAGKLIYAGRVGTGFSERRLDETLKLLKPLTSAKMPLDVPPPRKTRFGSPLVLSRVHWLKPKLVAEVRFQNWTADGLLRHTAWMGMRKDKKAQDVRREQPVGAHRGT